MLDQLSIVVPVYNERATIAAVIDRLLTIDLPVPREVIVVNDGSADGTREVLDDLAARYPELNVIHSAENCGKGHAVRMGFARAAGTIVAIQDADLELDPAELAVLVEPILTRATDVVYGSRFLSGQRAGSRLNRAANRFLTGVTNLLYGSSLTDMETCYKVIRTDVVRSLALSANRFDLEPEITAQLLLRGHAIVERPVTFSPRSRAAGKKIHWHDGFGAIKVLVRCRFQRGRR
jgi:glycosyltransferase involved in cell wall biosynthesis